MTPYLIHDAAGRILRYGQLVNDADLELQPLAAGESIIAAGPADSAFEYVAAGALAERPACPISASVAGLVVTLAGVPLGAVVRVTGDAAADIAQDDASGAMEITAPTAGRYRFDCDPFPAQAYSATFDLTT